MSEPVLANLVIYFLTCLCLCFLFILFKALWWTPRRLQRLMAAQGIRGPPYRFFHGNNKEIQRMTNEVMATPMELSHHTFPRLLPHFYTWNKLYGTNFLIWIGPKPQLVVTDPELVKVVLNNRYGVYPKPNAEGYFRKLMGDGLVTALGEKWHKQRKIAQHAFNTDNLKGMANEMVKSVEMMLERWRNCVGKEIEVYHEFKLLTSEVISRTAFGSSFLEGERIFDMLTKMVKLMQKNTYNVRFPVIGKFVKTRDDIESDMLERGMRDSIIKMVRKREERVMSGEAKDFGSDFLGSLVSAYHSDDKSKKMSLDDLVGECKTFYLGGQVTTLTWLSWTVFLLAIHTYWQDKAREEVLQVFGQENPSVQDLARLTIMTMIMNESIRLYGPIPDIERKASREVRLGDIIVPADMEVNILPLALHQNSEIWGEDAHLFKPERFAEGVDKATNNNKGACIPFGLGARACVGTNFAVNETKIALSMILQRYTFTLSPNYTLSTSNSPITPRTRTADHSPSTINFNLKERIICFWCADVVHPH